MASYIAKRIFFLLLTFLIIISICFVAIRLLPDDPPEQFGKDMQLVLQSRYRQGLTDKDGNPIPLLVQYGNFLKNTLLGFNWGISEKLYLGQDCLSIFLEKLPNTVLINFYASLLAIPLGLALGIYSALKKNRWQDHLISTGVMVLVSVPSYVYAFLIQYFLCFRLKLFPVVMEAGTDYFSPQMLRSMIPPVLSLSLSSIAGYARFTRGELTEVLTGEFLLLARAKGLSRRQTTLRHALRNAMVPIVPSIISEVIAVLSGSLIIESIFVVPGVGSLYVSAITALDYNFFLLLSAFYTIIGLTAGIVVDLSYGFIDPRIRIGAKMREINEIPAEKFRFVTQRQQAEEILPGKHIGYFREAFGRFRKNKSSVVAGIIILCLVAYAVFVPIFCQTPYSKALTDTTYLQYTKLKPKIRQFSTVGFWDGCSVKTLGKNNYLYLQGISAETGFPVIRKVLSKNVEKYKCRVDSYTAKGFAYMTLPREEYEAIRAWERENEIRVIYPAVEGQTDANIWYKADKKGVPLLENGNYVNQYSLDENGNYRYGLVTGDGSSYRCRVFLYTYFQYRYGYEPAFVLGTTGQGQDILTRLASAARFSLLFALGVSAINLFIGAVYGAIEGYYGGTADLLMERFTDILSRVPFLVVATLFQLHLAAKVGPIVSLLFAFVLTGWLGIADITRMQFYRYKDREFVEAARVLGAKNARIMFRHIFPNALGTIITGSVLVIPGVIFLESSLTYLGIVNLDSSQMTSVGTMLANGRQYLSTDPHIILFPALFISLLEISFNLFGNGLRDAFNPSLRGAEP